MPKYLSPKGLPIIGTAEVVPAMSAISGITSEGKPIYEGGTTLYWDDQKTKTRGGAILFVDEDGESYTFAELVEEIDEEEDEDKAA